MGRCKIDSRDAVRSRSDEAFARSQHTHTMQPQQPPGFSSELGGESHVVEGTVVEGTVVQPAAQPVTVIQPAAQPVFLTPEDVRARGLVVVQPQPVYGQSKVMPMPVHGQMMMMPQVVRPPGHWNGGQPCGCCDPPGGCPLCCITYWCPCAPVAELYDGVVRPGSYGEVFTILCIAPARAEIILDG